MASIARVNVSKFKIGRHKSLTFEYGPKNNGYECYVFRCIKRANVSLNTKLYVTNSINVLSADNLRRV